jgi:hypothetical protein
MLTCNLIETMHNFWFQQFGNRGICLFVATFDHYMQKFKESSVYYAFLSGAHLGLVKTRMNYDCIRLINLGT